jgi:hypothetical protein
VISFLVTWLMGFVAPSYKVVVTVACAIFVIVAIVSEYGVFLDGGLSLLQMTSVLAVPVGSAMAAGVWWRTNRNRQPKG